MTFYSVLIGVGLKALIEHQAWGYERWLCFAIALPLVLRFLIGSSNQLWFEYVRIDPPPQSRVLMLWDFAWLIIFGIAAMAMCYAVNPEAFLWWNLAFGILVILGNGCGNVIRRRRKLRAAGFWFPWFVINAVYAVIALWAALSYKNQWMTSVMGSSFGVDWVLIVFAIASNTILLFDLRHQLNVLDNRSLPDA